MISINTLVNSRRSEYGFHNALEKYVIVQSTLGYMSNSLSRKKCVMLLYLQMC